MTYPEIDKYLLSFASTWVDFPFGEKKAVYKVGSDENAKMFALVDVDARPLRVSLRTDPRLSKNLRAKYEEVQAGSNLDRRFWITVVNSGQLTDDEIQDLARLSYQLASNDTTL